MVDSAVPGRLGSRPGGGGVGGRVGVGGCVLICCLAGSVGGWGRPAATSSRGLDLLPATARGPVSSALGRDAAAYRIVGASGGLTGANAGQGLRLRFDGRGVSLVSPAGALGLELVALGGGGSLGPVPRVAPTASANRVVYRRPGLEEWYANGPLGLEQGFTLTHRPAGRGAVTLALRLSGSLARSARLEGGTLRLGSLVYRDLVASDAAGRRLPARLELAGRRLLIRVDVRRARYPLTIDPLIQQGSKLTGSGATSSRQFRLQRRGLRRRQDRPDRRYQRQRQCRGGLGVHALGNDVDPANDDEAHRD